MIEPSNRLQAPWVGCGPDEYEDTEEARYEALERRRELDAEEAEWEKYREKELQNESV